METAVFVIIAAIAAFHLWALILEMFLWQKPLGLRTFRQSPQNAASSAVLAANQGLYNGFLAVGLIVSLVLRDRPFQLYFLICVLAAGLYGAWSTKSRSILFFQAAPAVVALVLLALR